MTRIRADLMITEEELAEEQRARRMALEEELRALEGTWGQTKPVVRYVERKMYTPMPPKEVKVRTVEYRDRIKYLVKPLGFFGRLGDKIDRFWNT